MNDKAKSLFPTVNPNIGELMKEPVSKEDVVNDDILIPEDESGFLQNKEKQMKDQNDIFVTGQKSTPQNKEEFTETSSDVKTEVKPEVKPRSYAHLAEARAKGAMTRKAKAEAKRKAKEEEKARKAEERRLRREATMERNRQKARERYHREKAKKEAIKQESKKVIQQKIIEDSKPRAPRAPVSRNFNQVNQGMDFNTFSQYMMKYEQMKDLYKKQLEENRARKEAEKKAQEKPKPEFNPKYPASLQKLYSRNKKKKSYF